VLTGRSSSDGASGDGPAVSAGPGEGVLAALERLVAGLRGRGVDVSLSQRIDATESLRHVDLARRVELRAALEATLVTHAHQRHLFADVFDRCFPARPSRAMARRSGGLVGEAGPTTAISDDLVPPGGARPDSASVLAGATLDLLVQRAGEDELRDLAEQLVAAFGGLEAGARSERYHVYRVLRAADLAALMRRAMAWARDGGVVLDRLELERRIERLRQLITEQVRAELAHQWIPGSGQGIPAAPFDAEMARATASELAEMRIAVRPLARQLAARLRRRRQSLRSGRVDMRATMRRSLQTGGVPLELAFRRPKVHRPEVFVLCDVSGSVADFAGFTLTFISALSDELARTRSFAFVDAVDEITRIVQDCPTVVEPWQLLQHGKVIGADGHSDYGVVFAGFWDRYCRADLTDRSTVIITGDARSNYRPPWSHALAHVAGRARAVYWLNPEPRAQWDTTDSIMRTYAPHCDAVFEVRTLRQLGAAVQQIL
jgi:uncharacterized protein